MADAKGSQEAEAYTHAYRAVRTIYRRHEQSEFAQERKKWFEGKDGKLLELLNKESDESLEPVNFFPDGTQEQDLENLDLTARFEQLGGLDLNNPSPDFIQEMFEPRVVNKYIQRIDSGEFEDSTADTRIIVTTKIPVTYDPKVHYPSDLSQLMLGPYLSDDHSLEARFKLMKRVKDLPEVRLIPRVVVSGTYYKGEAPADDFRCMIPSCNKDLR